MTYSSVTPSPAVEPEPQQPRQATVRTNMPRPFLTYVILGVTVVFYLLQLLSNSQPLSGWLTPLANMVISPDVETALTDRGLYSQLFVLMRGGAFSDLLMFLGAKVNPLVAIGQVWRLFTPALLHASITHIGFNMYALYAFGTFIEPAYGRTRFLLLYILSAFGGNVLSFLLSSGVSVGASTAIFGLVGAQGVFIYQNRSIFGSQARSILTNVVAIVAINLLLGLSPGIDNWGHLGGLLAGTAFAWFASPLFSFAGVWPEYHLEDQRSSMVIWTTAALVALVFAGLAYYGMVAR